MTTVIAAIDNSVAAGPTLTAAQALAKILGAEVRAIHVSEDDGDTARACAARLDIPFTRLPGDPFRQILQQVAAPDVVGVAVGARQHLQDPHIGHLARRLANAIDKPVLVVPPEAAPVQEFGTALIAMAGTPATARTIKAAVEVAVGADLDVVVVHVDDESSIPSFSDQAAHETDSYAREFLARYAPGAPMARLELRIGSPVEQILEVAQSTGADVLALGWPQSADPDRGSVARDVLDRSPVPVMLVALGDTPTIDLTATATRTVMR